MKYLNDFPEIKRSEHDKLVKTVEELGYKVLAISKDIFQPEVHCGNRTTIGFNGLVRNTPKAIQRKLKKLYND